MQVDEQCVEATKYFEGFEARSYHCPAGYWTIGYGNRYWGPGDPVKEGDTISEAQAETLLRTYFRTDVEPALDRLFQRDLTQGQRNALGMFVYNVGEEKARRYPITERINNGQSPEDTARNLVLYNKIRDPETRELRPLLGLHRRRMVEAAMYLELPQPLRFANVGWSQTPDSALIPEYRERQSAQVSEPVVTPEAQKPAEQPTSTPRPPTRIEDSVTVDGVSRQRSGSETARIGGVLSFTSLMGFISDMATSQTFSKVLLLVFVICLMAWVFGLIQKGWGERLTEEGRALSTGPKE